MTESEKLPSDTADWAEMVRVVENNGWVVEESEDENPDDRGIFAYWTNRKKNPPVKWASTCESVHDIYDALIAKEAGK